MSLLFLSPPLSPSLINNAQPFVFATEIREKCDICKPNEAYMAGSCTPSKAEANCVLLHSKQMTGKEGRVTDLEVNEGMGCLLRKSWGQWAHVQLSICLVTIAAWSPKQNSKYHWERSEIHSMKNTLCVLSVYLHRPSGTLPLSGPIFSTYISH